MSVKPRRVLVVDDDPLILNLIAAVLDDGRFTIDVAEDGETALALAREHTPDVVVLDVMMPGMDGYEVCRSLRAEGSVARIVVLTAKVADVDRDEAMQAGADAFFTKPFSPLQLIDAVNGTQHGAA